MPGRRAGSGVGKYNDESPKQISKRFNFITKTIHFSSLLLLFIYGPKLQTSETPSCNMEHRDKGQRGKKAS